MKRRDDVPSADLRGFRWNLRPAESRLEAQLEVARLALARLHQQSRDLDEAQRLRAARHTEQERSALRDARRDVYAGAHAMRYLAHLEAERVREDEVRAEVHGRAALARQECARLQRQLDSLQALRLAAQREHTQARLRRECREADAAWLAMIDTRRATRRCEAGSAP